MKKYFRFFTVAAMVAAAGLAGCSSEEPVPSNGNTTGGGSTPAATTGKPTAATFRFDVDGSPVGTSTRSSVISPEVTENFSAAKLRVILFSDNTTKEVDTVWTVGSAPYLTIQLTSGNKFLYVIANAPGGATYVSHNVYTGTDMHGVLSNGTTTTLLNNNVWSVAGSAASGWDGDLTNIAELYPSSGELTASNSVDSTSVTLAGNVTPSQSQSTDASVNQGNFITVDLMRAVAKIKVTQTVPSGPAGYSGSGVITLDSTGIISQGANAPTYTVLNVNQDVYPFQHTAGGVITPHYLAPGMTTNYPGNEQFYARGQIVSTTGLTAYQDNGLDTIGIGVGTSGTTPIAIVPASGSSIPYYYVTENVNNEKRYATFAAIKAQFVPIKGKYTSAVAYNETSHTFAPTLGASDAAAGTFYYLASIGSSPETGLSVGAVVAGTDAQTVAWHIAYLLENPDVAYANVPAYVSGATDDGLMAKYFKEYTNGICYYRLDIGVGTNKVGANSIVWGAKRNTQYGLNIDSYKTLGSNRVGDLIGNPGEQLTSQTNMTVTMTMLPWFDAESHNDI